MTAQMERLVAVKTTRITVETETLIIVHRAKATSDWCPDCCAHVDVITLDSDSLIELATKAQIHEWRAPEAAPLAARPWSKPDLRDIAFAMHRLGEVPGLALGVRNTTSIEEDTNEAEYFEGQTDSHCRPRVGSRDLNRASPVAGTVGDAAKRGSASSYSVIDLGVVGATGGPVISDNGVVSGAAATSEARMHAALWFEGQRLDISTPDSADRTV